MFASIPYVASINERLKRAFLSNDMDYHTKPGQKLGDILCSSNRTHPNPIDKKGVYQQTCSCSPDAKYIGQTRVSFKIRMGQHQSDVSSPKLDENISGISKHVRHCNSGSVTWEDPKILSCFNDKNKKHLTRNLLIRESLEIRRQKTSSGDGLNDPQLAVKSNAWDPILIKLK